MALTLSIPVWVLLAFSLWTLILLGATIGTHRWSRILTGRANFATYGEYRIEGSDAYARAMRAHANCVENLPVYGGIVLFGLAAGSAGVVLDVLALLFIGARIGQSAVHVALPQSNAVVACRSAFYNTQWLCMMGMGGIEIFGALVR